MPMFFQAPLMAYPAAGTMQCTWGCKERFCPHSLFRSAGYAKRPRLPIQRHNAYIIRIYIGSVKVRLLLTLPRFSIFAPRFSTIKPRFFSLAPNLLGHEAHFLISGVDFLNHQNLNSIIPLTKKGMPGVKCISSTGKVSFCNRDSVANCVSFHSVSSRF